LRGPPAQRRFLRTTAGQRQGPIHRQLMGAVSASKRAGSLMLATEPLAAASRPVAEGPRPEVRGKFLFVGDATFHVRGVTYGAFRPDERDQEYRNLEAIDADFAHMAANGINAVRIPHTMPPRALLDLAAEHGLRVMVGLSAEQYVGFLIDRKGAPDVAEIVRA